MDWKEMSNSEIEVKLKSLEFEYQKTNDEITNLGKKLNELSSEYNKGKYLLEKRIMPNNFK
jgi:hypothetical protein